MVSCPVCGLANPPTYTDCGNCGTPLQDAASVEARCREWEALPPSFRHECENRFEQERGALAKHRERLTRHRALDIVVASLATSMIMNGNLCFPSVWPILIDVIIGAGAAVWLHKIGGGAFRGLGIFLVACLASCICRAPFINMTTFWSGWWLFAALSISPIVCLGYFMGLKVEASQGFDQSES